MPLQFRLHYLPIFTTVWFLFTFFIPYVVAISNKHVNKLFPYISDVGSLPPESCIFGVMLNIGAFLVLIIMYVRFRIVQLINHRGFSKNYRLCNNFSQLFGSLSCLGLSIVANFQQTSELTVHFVGAFLAFAVGSVYCLIQTYLTWLSFYNNFLKYFRTILSCLLLPLYVTTVVCTILSFAKLDGDAFKWNSTNPGYELHLIATFSEWIMAILLILYIVSFYVEFKDVKYGGILITLKDP